MDINDVLESENPSEYLYYYAQNNGRLNSKWERLFLEFKDTFYITCYTEDIIQERWPEAEPILLESKDVWEITYYIEYVMKKRWPEAELILLESKDASELYYYIKWVIKGRWPEAEPLIRQNKDEWKDYCEWLNIRKKNGPK